MNAARVVPAAMQMDAPIRDCVREVATEMLIRNGYQGFRFRDIADALDTTRTNVHYHFGNKEALCEYVIVAYVVGTSERFQRILTLPGALADKIMGTMESNRERYLKYNPSGKTAHPWSLIARMRLERGVIGYKARQMIANFSVVLERLVTKVVEAVIGDGELRTDAPVEDIALQPLAIVLRGPDHAGRLVFRPAGNDVSRARPAGAACVWDRQAGKSKCPVPLK